MYWWPLSWAVFTDSSSSLPTAPNFFFPMGCAADQGLLPVEPLFGLTLGLTRTY